VAIKTSARGVAGAAVLVGCRGQVLVGSSRATKDGAEVRAVREMRVAVVGVSAPESRPLLLLQERYGQRRVVPIWIGVSEATVIELERNHIAASRPATHELVAQVVHAFGRRLVRVCLTDLAENVYHAQLVFDRDVRVSARPSDAVALALHTGVSIWAEDVVLAQAGLSPTQVVDLGSAGALPGPEDLPAPGDSADHRDELERFRRFLNDTDPNDFDTD
jgi:hypothetical protein